MSDTEAQINKDARNFDELVEVLNDHSLLKAIHYTALVHITELPQQLLPKSLNRCCSHEHSKGHSNAIRKQSARAHARVCAVKKFSWVFKQRKIFSQKSFTRKFLYMKISKSTT